MGSVHRARCILVGHVGVERKTAILPLADKIAVHPRPVRSTDLA